MDKELEVGDKVRLAPVGLFSYQPLGVITEVHSVPGQPHLTEYSVKWEDGKFPNEIWDCNDFEQDGDYNVKLYND